MMDSLIQVMHNLERLHRSLLKVAFDKMHAIKENDIHQLNELLKEEQSHLAAIVQLDRSREDIVRQLLQQKEPVTRPEEMTISKLLEQLDGSEREQLIEARDQLLQTIVELKNQNELNQKLTFQSLQFVNLSLDMVRPQQGNSMNYSKNEVAGIRDQASTKGAFDSKA